MTDTTPIGPLLQTVFESILEVFLLCVAGYVLAVRGVLDKKTQKQLNRLNVSLFTPSLLFSKVAFFLSPSKLRELWIIPIFFVITTGVSMVVAYAFGWMLRLKRSQRSFAVAASMFMNSNSLPIALMQSLVITVPGLKWGEDDNKDAMVGRALTYLVLYSTLGMVVRWSYGVRLLSNADPESSDAPRAEHNSLIGQDETAFPPSHEEQRILHHEPSAVSLQSDGSETLRQGPDTGRSSAETIDHLNPNAKMFYPYRRGQPEPPTASGSGSSSDNGEDDDDNEGLPPVRRHVTPPTSSRWQSRVRRSWRRTARLCRTVHEFMTAPLWAALASLVVACIQPLQHALEEHAPPLKGALTMAGNCSIPLTLVVLGAYFYTPQDPESQCLARLAVRQCEGDVQHEAALGWQQLGQQHPRGGQRPGETKTVIVAVMSRMILTPLLLLPLMALSAKFDWQEVFEDPVFVVANVLLVASPPALTLAQITQAASGDAFERLISRTIFWSYCVITPPSTIVFVVIGLILSKL
ncbi:auxin efflux carrier [Amylocystis lapponica]|nr:auxin efflux carrier [Amylocystis lapponica]